MTILKPCLNFIRLKCFMTIMLLIIMSFAFSACASFSSQKKGIKLSDAVEEAKKEPDKQKVLKPKMELDEWDYQQSDVELSVSQSKLNADDNYARLDTSVVNSKTTTFKTSGWRLGPVIGIGTMKEQFDAFSLFGFKLYFPDLKNRVCASVGLQYMHTNFSDESRLSTGLDNEMEIALVISGRKYFTPPHTLMGIYAHGGIRQGLFLWRYRNPIHYIENGEVKGRVRDQIGTFSAYFGLGISLVQMKHLHIGGNISGGLRGYYKNTVGGFENDIFNFTSYYQLMLELTFCSPE